MLSALRLHSREAFQTWLASDLEIRDELEAEIAAKLGVDRASLDVLESFLLARYRTQRQILKLGERAILDAAARHVGLIMVLTLDDAAWDIELDDEDNAYYRLPIIRLADGAEECPLTMVTAALDRRKLGYLRGIVDSYE